MGADVCFHLAFLNSYKYILEKVSFLSPLERKMTGAKAQVCRAGRICEAAFEFIGESAGAAGGEATVEMLRLGRVTFPAGLPDALLYKKPLSR